MSVDRRTVLKSIGGVVALPFLESLARATPKRRPPVRLAVLYMPNGTNPHTWTPAITGRGWDLTPTLAPLASCLDRVLIVSGLWNKGSKDGDGHYVKTSGFLTGTTIKKTTGRDLASGGPSMDQLAAQRVGRRTPLPSLEL